MDTLQAFFRFIDRYPEHDPEHDQRRKKERRKTSSVTQTNITPKPSISLVHSAVDTAVGNVNEHSENQLPLNSTSTGNLLTK